MIEITNDNLKKYFIEYNKTFFDNKLSMPNFKIKTTFKRIGCCQMKRGNNFTILMTDAFRLSDEQFSLVLIHEMVHLYEHQVLHTLGGHGLNFKRKASDIRHKSNGKINIARTIDLSKTPLTEIGELKAKKREENAQCPVLAIAIEQNKANRDNEIGWIFQLSNPLYEKVFNDGGFKCYKDLRVVGFVYDVPKGSVLRLKTCNTRLHGKRMEWSELCETYHELISKMTKRHRDFKWEEYQQIIFNY